MRISTLKLKVDSNILSPKQAVLFGLADSHLAG
jgi:hypothetical protein